MVKYFVNYQVVTLPGDYSQGCDKRSPLNSPTHVTLRLEVLLHAHPKCLMATSLHLHCVVWVQVHPKALHIYRMTWYPYVQDVNSLSSDIPPLLCSAFSGRGIRRVVKRLHLQAVVRPDLPTTRGVQAFSAHCSRRQLSHSLGP